MTSGHLVLERLFPGFRAELEQRGAVGGDVGTRPFFLSGVRFAARESDMRLLGASRGLLESYTRQRLREQRNLRILDQCDVLGLIGTAAAIRGVRIVRRQFNAGQQLAADLVVDTTGRGSKMPRWLEALERRTA